MEIRHQAMYFYTFYDMAGDIVHVKTADVQFTLRVS